MTAVPLNGQTWLICGGRDFADQAMFDEAMSELVQHMGCPSLVVHGACGDELGAGEYTGADGMADKWAKRMGITVAAESAEWMRFGKQAGPIRNQGMLRKYKPARVIAFPGGRGTVDMVCRAHATREATGKPDVIEVKPK